MQSMYVCPRFLHNSGKMKHTSWTWHLDMNVLFSCFPIVWQMFLVSMISCRDHSHGLIVDIPKCNFLIIWPWTTNKKPVDPSLIHRSEGKILEQDLGEIHRNRNKSIESKLFKNVKLWKIYADGGCVSGNYLGPLGSRLTGTPQKSEMSGHFLAYFSHALLTGFHSTVRWRETQLRKRVKSMRGQFVICHTTRTLMRVKNKSKTAHYLWQVKKFWYTNIWAKYLIK